MYAKDLHGNNLRSREYRAEVTSRMSRIPVNQQNISPQYAKIKNDSRSHHCVQCDKLHYEIERLQMQLAEKSSRGSIQAVLDSKESRRSGEFRHDRNWEASWAATPDLLSTHSKGDDPRQRRQYKELEEDVQRLRRELHQKSLEVRLLRNAPAESNKRYTSPNVDVMIDPLPAYKVAEMYIDIYKEDWKLANQALLNDKMGQEQSATKLLSILIAAFAYCDEVAPEHFEAILASAIKVQQQGSRPIPKVPVVQVNIQQETGLFRKCIAEKVAQNIVKNFRFDVFMKMKEFTTHQKQNYDITKYVDKCVNITWYMAVQNYPIILDDSVSHEKPFDFQHYDLFREEGEEEETVYAYLLWPALINAQNNTVVCKGVAEKMMK